MKKILITGKDSYIGTSLEEWLAKEPENYQVDTVGTRNEEWKSIDFSYYDVIFHVAGIAHIKETKENKELYYKVNRDLAYEIAKKAKNEGIEHFIFLSSMSVYGMETGVITKDTVPKPKTAYGRSKLEAEKLLKELERENYKIAIVRPPMVYGKGCKGNYPKLSKLAKTTLFFPKIENQRSMIYIFNLTEYIKILIDEMSEGLFLPQNSEYVSTVGLIKTINEVNQRKVLMTGVFDPLLAKIKASIVLKVFGTLVYEHEEPQLENKYNIFSFFESIKMTER